VENITGNSAVVLNFNMSDLDVALVEAVESALVKTWRTTYTYGKSQLKVNDAYLGGQTLNAAPLTLNLFSGLKSIFNQDVSLTSIKDIFIANLATESGSVLTVGNAASQGCTLGLGGQTETMEIGPLGWRHICEPIDGIAAGSSFGNILLDPGAKVIPFQIVVIGENNAL
jgi:hypothetical protein